MVSKATKLLLIGIVFVFLLGLLLGIVIPRLDTGSGPRIVNTSTILTQVRTLSQLVTVQYVLEKIVILEVPPDSVLGQMFAGDNRVLLLAHGIVKAGVDLSQIKDPDIQVKNDVVQIRLPRARITDAYLDDSQTKVIERSTGLFRSFDKDLEQSARQTALDDIRRAARLSGIVKDADERARAQLKALCGQMGLKVELIGQ